MMATSEKLVQGTAAVQAIDADAVHRICSGQVVVDLATAVKELVENSLDAGSTQVDIRLRDHGSQLIEVSDNGKGIAPDDYAGITRKHCTSKLKNFSDLAQVETFGFRGEALSSLCAVAEVTIATRQAHESVGTRLTYDHRGEITGRTPCAREPGTTITVQELFSTLPVRHKQLQKNVKREYGRLLHVLQAYCLISDRARIHCTNQNGEKGQRQVVVASANRKPADKRRKPTATADASGATPATTCSSASSRPAGSDKENEAADGTPGLLLAPNSPPPMSTKTEAAASSSGTTATCASDADAAIAGVATANNAAPSTSSSAAPSSSAWLRENVASVFGTKQLSSLLAVEQCANEDARQQLLDDGVSEGSLPPAAVLDQFSIGGLISDCRHGSGRSSADRQFFYINERPWDGAKATKVVNDVYRSFNRHQAPFVLLMVAVAERSSVDVNLTPDKRSMLLEHERAFIAVLKRSLSTLFQARDGCFDGGPASMSKRLPAPTAQPSGSSSPPPQSATKGSSESLKRRFSELRAAAGAETAPKQPRLSAFGFSASRSESVPSSELDCGGSGRGPALSCGVGAARESGDDVVDSSDDVTFSGVSSGDGALPSVSARADPLPSTAAVSTRSSTPSPSATICTSSGASLDSSGISDASTGMMDSCAASDPSLSQSLRSPIDNTDADQALSPRYVAKSPQRAVLSTPSPDATVGVAEEIPSRRHSLGLGAAFEQRSGTTSRPSPRSVASPLRTADSGNNSYDSDNSECVVADRDDSQLMSDQFCLPDRQVKCSLQSLASRLRGSADRTVLAERQDTCDDAKTSFMVRIGPDTNEAAEKELERFVSKSSFAGMSVVGQFNLGFIVARSDTDLFLVDQHASDEKYNFERLQRTAQPRQQPLVIPQPLCLPASSEQVVMDNMAVFEQSGFRLAVDAEAPPTKRVRLTAAPASRGWSFGGSDVEEMVFMLRDAAPGQVVRPTRLRAMFASRACRSSIMVGRALNRAEMLRLLRHMSEMEQPWNCPHGRPTMRHLFDLTQVSADL